MKINYLLIILILIQLITICFAIHVNMNYIRLKRTYKAFMKGKDGRTLERSILENTSRIEDLENISEKNITELKRLSDKSQCSFQKTAIVKYDAFGEEHGALSFALTILDENNNGWIINYVQGSFRNYNYIKEIVNGESYIELTNEEKESLEKAIDRELNDLREESDTNNHLDDTLEIGDLGDLGDLKDLENLDNLENQEDREYEDDLDILDIEDIADIDTNDEEDI